MGRDKLDNAWKGLVKKGYIFTTKLKNGNLNSGYFHEVFENPKLDNPKFGDTENQSTHKTVDKESNKIEINNNIKNNINNTSIEKNNTTVKDKISLKEYREILNPYFDKHTNWESDLLKYEPENFISKYKSYYYDIDSYEITFMINEFFQL
jgi:hypothetical protein